MKKILSMPLIMGLIGTASFVLLMIFAPGFAKDAEAIVMLAIFIAIFALVDKYMFPGFNLIDLIKNKEVDYAKVLIAIAIVFHAICTLLK
jgi:hypothetical protein